MTQRDAAQAEAPRQDVDGARRRPEAAVSVSGASDPPPAAADHLNTPQRVKKTVLELDLVGYSDIARFIEENLDVHSLKTFEDQIQSFVAAGLERLALQRDEVVFGKSGDNAIILFDSAETMHKFADAVQHATLSHNRSRSVELAKRWFRMGAATGDVLIDPRDRRIVGTTIARAVRLEAAADKGQLAIDRDTFEALPPELQHNYGPEEVVRGKRDERFPARRCTFVELQAQATGPAASPGKASAAGPAPATHAPASQAPRRHAKRALILAPLLAGIAFIAAALAIGWHPGAPPAPPRPAASADSAAPVPFARNQVMLTGPAQAAIDRQAAFLKANPQATVTVKGDCTAEEGKRFGPGVLAELRANKIRDELTARYGIDAGRIRTQGGAGACAAPQPRALIVRN